MGAALTKAQAWFVRRREDLSPVDQQFIAQSIARDKRAKGRTQWSQTLSYAGLAAILIAVVGLFWGRDIVQLANWYIVVRPYALKDIRPFVLGDAAEHMLKPGQTFRECLKDCPDMIVVPAGSFTMGSPVGEDGRADNDQAPRRITIANLFAVSRSDVTFAEWDACVALGGCEQVSSNSWGRGLEPVINVSWDEAQQYVVWLSRMTERTYRLLSEAEWEYAARSGTTTAFYWGPQIGKNHADCFGCGTRWDGLQPAPVGSFPPNAFGLYDMAGNVWQWVADCPKGSGSIADACKSHVVRGGSWDSYPRFLRSASRYIYDSDVKVSYLGFRVARTLQP